MRSVADLGPEITGPIRLDGMFAAYFVGRAGAHLFASRPGDHGQAARRHFVAQIPVGGLIPAVDPDRPIRLDLVPLPGGYLTGISGAVLHRLMSPAVAGPAGPGLDVAAAIDRLLQALADGTRQGQPPRGTPPMQSRQVLSLASGQAITGNSHVWWVRTIGGSVLRNDGGSGQRAAEMEFSLLAGRDWLTAETACTLEVLRTGDLIETRQLSAALRHHMDQTLTVISADLDAAGDIFVRSLHERKRVNAAAVAEATRGMIGVVGSRALRRDVRVPSGRSRYQDAVSVLAVLAGDSADTVVEPADQRIVPGTARDALRAVARSSSLHLRDTTLPDRWWRRDLGPLVGWRVVPDSDWSQPVPLMFRRGRYREIDPGTHAERPVGPARAAGFDGQATQVQVPLPITASLRTVLTTGLTGAGADGWNMLIAAGIVALLGLVTPLITGVMLAQIQGSGSARGLVEFPLLLVSAAAVAALMSVLQNLRLLRLQGRVESGTQLALWDRLLRLPVSYFRGWSSGELASAVLGISLISESVGGVLSQALASALTVLADLALIMVLSIPLGISALAVTAAALILMVALGRAAIRRGRGALPGEHALAAFTNQLVSGVTRIKLAGAEDRAFGRWSVLLTASRTALIRLRQVQAVTIALSTVLPLAGQFVLFALLAGPLSGQVSLTSFLMINVAFTMLLGALLMLATASVEVFAAVPRLEVLAPVVSATPERLPDRSDPGDLYGDVDVSGVTFGYRAEDVPVLQDVSFHVRPGEFVAVVGPSGSGKSTLLRLLLGFDRPRSGAILYDGKDLSELDVQAVRRQCGVVLQDGQLFAGTLRENICGTGDYSLDQVWRAAKLAGIDAEIEALPMGMATMVPVGGGTLSAGQRQRVLIARALIRSPRLVFFDEATSALDNRVQEIVTASTRDLAATRIVIAHRLSTIVAADRIIVLDRGRVVQQGSYLDLMRDRDGLFYRLAARQLLNAPVSEPTEVI